MSTIIKTAVQQQWDIQYDNDQYNKPGEWKVWFAWCPVQLLDGSWVNRERIYRRYASLNSYDANGKRIRYEYASIFDVIGGK